MMSNHDCTSIVLNHETGKGDIEEGQAEHIAAGTGDAGFSEVSVVSAVASPAGLRAGSGYILRRG